MQRASKPHLYRISAAILTSIDASGASRRARTRPAKGRKFVEAARKLNVTVHVTKNDDKRRSNLDRRTTWHAGYAISLSRRWLAEKGQRTS
jgi:hypothetical protein